MRTQLGTILVVAGLAATTACVGGAAAGGRPDPGSAAPASVSTAAAQQVTLTARDTMRFEPSTIAVTAGQPVQLTLRNEGRMPHDVALSEGVARRVKIKADGGETASGTFTIERPGTYTFVCSVPGHEAAGMTGTITAR
jgi:nitrite reductase (NO-forming)